MHTHVLFKQNLKLKVCFRINLLIVKIKQVVRLNAQSKRNCLINLFVIILLREKIEHAFKFTVL